MNDQNMRLSVIAYYLSKYDLQAIDKLGYKSRAEALKDVSMKLGNGNNYLKLRRDEFDVLTGSHRRGYANRKPSRGVLELHSQLKEIPFSDFTDIVSQFICPTAPVLSRDAQKNILEVDTRFSDLEIEAIINAKDPTSTILLRQTEQKSRVYNHSIIDNLKKLYQYRCQICGYSSKEYGISIVEAHHLLSFAEAKNNDSDNIIILCPNHHRLIHRAVPVFERQRRTFVFPNGLELQVELNLHLQ